MTDHSPSTDERASLAQPSQSSSPLECTSHLGFSLEGRHAANVDFFQASYADLLADGRVGYCRYDSLRFNGRSYSNSRAHS